MTLSMVIGGKCGECKRNELFKNYDPLPEDLKSELSIKHIWALVPEESDIA
jgi:hypothetical protein